MSKRPVAALFVGQQQRRFQKLRAVRKTAMVAVALSMASTGCQTTNITAGVGAPVRSAVAYCAGERAPFEEAREGFSSRVWTGAAIGAGAGAAAGAVIGDGDVKAILLGTAAGALLGAGVGYLEAKRKQGLDSDQILSSINADAMQDRRKLQGLSEALYRLNACRDRQIQELVDTSVGVPISERRSRLADVEAAIANDNELIGEVVGGSKERRDIFVKAAAEESAASEFQILGNAQTVRVRVIDPSTRSSSAPSLSSATLETRTASRVRSGATTGSKHLGTLPPGSQVVPLGRSADGEWVEISYGGRTAYVFAELLIEPGAQVGSPSSGIKEVTVVPAKQGDNALQGLTIEQVAFDARKDAYNQQLQNRIETAKVSLEI